MLLKLFSSPLGVLFLGTLVTAALAATGGDRGVLPPPADLPPVSDLPSQPELPDPLTTFEGRRVTSREQWEQERRPELKKLFQHYMYGYMPPPPAKVHAAVER